MSERFHVSLPTGKCSHRIPNTSLSALFLSRKSGPKKIVIFLLAIAGAASDSVVQTSLTWAGTFFAIFILGSNLGSRAWHNMCLTKQRYSGPLYAVIASIKAFGIGLLFPYFGCRGCEPGGQVALENTLKSALIVAIVFILSGFREFGQIFIVGSDVSGMHHILSWL